jgi:hypothetical protein
MSAAIITASASVFVAMLAFVLGQIAQLKQERRQARLTRISNQLRDLYGPLNTLVDVNERIWEELRSSHLPPKAYRSPEAGTDAWTRWRDHALMPNNRKMRDLIIEHADLIVGLEMPQPLKDFSAHVMSLEIVLAAEAEGSRERALIGHPGDTYLTYVRETYVNLKAEQQRLLRGLPI